MSLLLKNCRLRQRDGLWDVHCQGRSIHVIGRNLDLPAERILDLESRLLVAGLYRPSYPFWTKSTSWDSVRKTVSGL